MLHLGGGKNARAREATAYAQEVSMHAFTNIARLHVRVCLRDCLWLQRCHLSKLTYKSWLELKDLYPELMQKNEQTFINRAARKGQKMRQKGTWTHSGLAESEISMGISINHSQDLHVGELTSEAAAPHAAQEQPIPTKREQAYGSVLVLELFRLGSQVSEMLKKAVEEGEDEMPQVMQQRATQALRQLEAIQGQEREGADATQMLRQAGRILTEVNELLEDWRRFTSTPGPPQ